MGCQLTLAEWSRAGQGGGGRVVRRGLKGGGGQLLMEKRVAGGEGACMK